MKLGLTNKQNWMLAGLSVALIIFTNWYITLIVVGGVWYGLFKINFETAGRNNLMNIVESRKNEIIDYDVTVNDTKSERYSKSAGALGTVVMGPLGLLAGNAFKKDNSKVNSIVVTVFFNDGTYISHDFLGLGSQKANSISSTQPLKEAQDYAHLIQSYIIQNEQQSIS